MKLIQFEGGVLQRHDDFSFGPLAPRLLDVWLPPGADHSELAWRERVQLPLQFLFAAAR